MFAIFLIFVSGACEAAWNYEHPETWEDRCGGVTQSPINFINDLTPLNAAPFVYQHYGLVNISLENNGHALNARLDPPPVHRPKVTGGGLQGWYVLEAFHFHWGTRHDIGSEHLLDGCAFSGEMHFVHYKEEYGSLSEALNYPDGLAVLGVWLRETPSDPEYISNLLAAKADNHLRGAVGLEGDGGQDQYSEVEHAAAAYYWLTNLSPSSTTVQDAHVHVHLRQLIPLDDSTFYRYQGSLTTPPCTESVMWTVFQDSVVIPRPLLQGLRKLTTPVPPSDAEHHVSHNDIAHSLSNNFRATQPLGNRTLYFSGDLEDRVTSCSVTPKYSEENCLNFPELLIDYEGSDDDTCAAQALDLHLTDAEVTLAPTLTWKRLGSCRIVSVVNDGRAIKVRYAPRSPQWQLTGSNLTTQYYLGEIVIRRAFKHLLGGITFPLEAHLIHYNAKYISLKEALKEGDSDGVVVVVKFFQEPVSSVHGFDTKYAGHNKNLHHIIEALEDEEKDEEVLATSPDIRYLMDSTSSYYEYKGPLPAAAALCNASITWLIPRKPSHVSRDQLGQLTDLLDDYEPSTSQAIIVPPKLLLRVSSPQMASEYRAILKSAKDQQYTSAMSSAIREEIPASINAGSSLQSNRHLFLVLIVFIIGSLCADS